MTAVRLAAVRALVRLERHRATLAAEIEHARHGIDDARDRALLHELLVGVERWRLALDTILERSARRTMSSVDPPVRAILRLGAYQLRHLDRIPPHAVVHESVEAARAVGAARAAGFVNAVLRRVQRTPAGTDLPPRPGPNGDQQSRVRYLSLTLSHPAWLIERWLSRHSFEEVETWCQYNNTAPTVTVRTGDDLTAELRQASVTAEPCRHVEGAWRLPAGAMSRLPDPLRSRLLVQDEGSQLVALAVRARAGQRVLDVCASPGGKSLILAAELEGSGLVCGDLRPPRVALLRDRLSTAGVGAPVVRFDASRPLPFGSCFDRVLLDAPCSGLGTLSRDPDVKWARRPGDIRRLARQQAAMIRSAADCVAPGGWLIYATCSSEPDENDAVVSAFLGQRPDFVPRPITYDARVRFASELLDRHGRLVTSPALHRMDAFFAAVLAREPAA